MSKQGSRCPFHDFTHISEFDALDPVARENPMPYYDWLRDDPTRAVYKLPHETDFYMVHRYDDVKSVFADTENFSNEIIPTVKSPFLALMDGEKHDRIRGVVSRLFSNKNMQQWEPEIQNLIANTTDNLFQSNSIDLFEQWANPIPLGTLASLFGINRSPASIKKLHDDSIAINKALFVTGGTGPRRSSKPSLSEKIKITAALIKNVHKILQLRLLLGSGGMKELRAMVNIKDKTLNVPRPNFEHIPAAISPLLDLMLTFAKDYEQTGADIDSLRIFKNALASGEVSKTEIMMAGAFILFAGYETTTSLLSNCFVHLARNRELFQKLKRDPEKIDDFIEEALRYYTPVGRFLRRAKCDVEVSGTLIPKGAIVIVMPGAANTDPEKFAQGCSFDMSRTNNRQHLSFGKGAHFCVGAPLARMQVSMALRELIHRADSLYVDETVPLKMVTDRDNGILRFEFLMVEVRKMEGVQEDGKNTD